MSAIQDHLIYCPEGFYDMNKYPERVEHGKKLLVTRREYRGMKMSDPSVELVRIQAPEGLLKSLVERARAEKRADEAAEKADVLAGTNTTASEQVDDLFMLDDELVPVDHVLDSPVADWKPVGWYKGQLNRNDGMEGIDV